MDLDPDVNLFNEILPSNCNYYTIPEFCDLNINQNNFSLLNYNVRSFHNIDNGNSLRAMLHAINIDFSCIVLSETWNNSQNVQLCQLPNYDSFHTYQPDGHVYSISGGISIFCRNFLAANQIENLSFCNADIEICVVEFKLNHMNFIVIAVYRPPQGSKSNFIQHLDETLSAINVNSSTVLISGDFNINLDLSDNAITVDLTSKLFSKSFLSLIDKPTRFPTGSLDSLPSTIDMICTNIHNVPIRGILDFDNTDHRPNFCTIELGSVNLLDDKIKMNLVHIRKIISKLFVSDFLM